MRLNTVLCSKFQTQSGQLLKVLENGHFANAFTVQFKFKQCQAQIVNVKDLHSIVIFFFRQNAARRRFALLSQGPSACVVVELPNFTQTFTPVGSTTTPDITSLCTSGQKLSTFEKGPKMMPTTAST